MDEQINNIKQLDEYYDNNNYNWSEIIESFRLTDDFMRNNIDNLNTKLLLNYQNITIDFVIEHIKYFEIKDVEKALDIKDPNIIALLQAKKDEFENLQNKTIEDKIEEKIEVEMPVVLDENMENSNEAIFKNEENGDMNLEDVLANVETNETPLETIIEEPIEMGDENIIHIDKIDEVKEENNIITLEEPLKIEEKNIENNKMVDIEFLCLKRLEELNIDNKTIVGDYLFKTYINKYNDLKVKYEFSINKFEDLILKTLNAR